MRYETVETHTFQADAGRPAIVIELREGRARAIKLLTGQSGNAQISMPELRELAAISTEADKFIKELSQPPLAIEE